jgi:hypothetical protein
MRREFLEFHRKNPWVYDRIKLCCEIMQNANWDQYSMRNMVSSIRLDRDMGTTGEEVTIRGGDVITVKINDHHSPYYARLLAYKEPRFENFFHFRRVRGEDPGEVILFSDVAGDPDFILGQRPAGWVYRGGGPRSRALPDLPFDNATLRKIFRSLGQPAQTTLFRRRRTSNRMRASFFKFHYSNPQVYESIVTICKVLRRRGWTHYSMRHVIQALRFCYDLQTGGETVTIDGGDDLTVKINNNHSPYYARLLTYKDSWYEDREFFEYRRVEGEREGEVILFSDVPGEPDRVLGQRQAQQAARRLKVPRKRTPARYGGGA